MSKYNAYFVGFATGFIANIFVGIYYAAVGYSILSFLVVFPFIWLFIMGALKVVQHWDAGNKDE